MLMSRRRNVLFKLKITLHKIGFKGRRRLVREREPQSTKSEMRYFSAVNCGQKKRGPSPNNIFIHHQSRRGREIQLVLTNPFIPLSISLHRNQEERERERVILKVFFFNKSKSQGL
jgi:hypothetical protein